MGKNLLKAFCEGTITTILNFVKFVVLAITLFYTVYKTQFCQEMSLLKCHFVKKK